MPREGGPYGTGALSSSVTLRRTRSGVRAVTARLLGWGYGAEDWRGVVTLPLWLEAREVSESWPYYDDFILCFWGKGVGMH